jgi:hypothetical protein
MIGFPRQAKSNRRAHARSLGKSGDFATRRSFIEASNARIIMGYDAAALISLWREKRGEADPEDLPADLIVQLGKATENLNRSWYERNTGRQVRTAPRCASRNSASRPGASRRTTRRVLRSDTRSQAASAACEGPDPAKHQAGRLRSRPHRSPRLGKAGGARRALPSLNAATVDV